MKNMRRLTTAALVILSVHLIVPVAFAHPLGNFTINHFAGITVRSDRISIDYILDMAEIPAFQEIDILDANQNEQADPGEVAGYHPARCEKILADLELRVNERRLALSLTSSALEFPPGQGGLPTLRLTCAFGALIPTGESKMNLVFENRSYAERLGWREIVVHGEGVSISGDFTTQSISDQLRSYPNDLLASPLDQRLLAITVDTAGSHIQAPTSANPPTAAGLVNDRNDAFTRLIMLEEINLPTLMLALAISLVWGAMHAMTPGHGKTIVGAYLVGARGTARHALYLGLATTITHTAGVFVLGLVTLFAARFILPETLFPWLSLISGLLVVSIGFNLFFRRLTSSGLAGRWRSVKIHGQKHPHPPIHDHHHHSPGHHHHDSHAHHHEHEHPHGTAQHSHLPPGADGAPVTWRNLLALGVSGGLIPCPSALVVLLSAIALDRIGFGLVLVFAFSLGLAGVLTGFGLLFVYAGRLFNRIPVQSGLIRILPALSALFITLVGLGITVRALVETGLIL